MSVNYTRAFGATILLLIATAASAQLKRQNEPDPATTAAPEVVTPLRKPAPPKPDAPALVEPSQAARESIGQQADQARREANKPVPAIAIRPNSSGSSIDGGLSGDSAPPRLLSIVGQPGRERADIAVNGYVFTASMANPLIGNTGWKLVEVNSASSTVCLTRGGAATEDHPKAAGAKRCDAYGFTRKESDNSQDQKTAIR